MVRAKNCYKVLNIIKYFIFLSENIRDWEFKNFIKLSKTLLFKIGKNN